MMKKEKGFSVGLINVDIDNQYQIEGVNDPSQLGRMNMICDSLHEKQSL